MYIFFGKRFLGTAVVAAFLMGWAALTSRAVGDASVNNGSQTNTGNRTFPGETWTTRTPEEVGLDAEILEEVSQYLGGRGCIIRNGYLVHHWGDYTRRGDVASAAKPWYSTLLFKAVEQGRLPSLNKLVTDYEPRLGAINGDELEHKDRGMTFAHMANQTSCYGVREAPGTAYDYNDWQMALFIDTLFLKVYGAAWETVDSAILHEELTDWLQCEDDPTFLAFGTKDRAGRMAVSPRDFARFGWLYLNEGLWNGRQIVSREHARMAVRSNLSNDIPRTAGVAADMIPGQRTIGSRRVPDNQTDHYGSYSWLWWVNGVNREGERFWPQAPTNTFAALGHANGMRGMAVLPSLDLVIAWNDTTLDRRPSSPHPLNEVFRLLTMAAHDAPMRGQVMVDPERPAWLAYNRDQDHDGKPDSLFLCGPGDPEGFLYRGARRPDGTRVGDQTSIIERVGRAGANCLYFQAVRSHGGDGDATHNPFVDGAPENGLDEGILQQWERWLTVMDDAGIAPLFFLYDDNARIWDTEDRVGPEEHAFIETLVNRFEHHKNIIWCIAEEYQERFSPACIKTIAQVIRDLDEHNHPIAVHKLDGLSFDEFAADPNIDQFAIQYNRPTAIELHKGMVEAWRKAKGRYNLNMSEAANYGQGATARKKHWACAMGGAYAMALGWSFDNDAPPSDEDLLDCGRLRHFFEQTDFNKMEPHDTLNYAGTKYLLAAPGHSYIAYASNLDGGSIGIKEMRAGVYDFLWFDIAAGTNEQITGVAVDAGDQAWAPPVDVRGEVAVWIHKLDSN